MKEPKKFTLYLVIPKEQVEPKYVVAENQAAAVKIMKDKYKNINADTCSIRYLGNVLTPSEEQDNKPQIPTWIPKVEYVRSVYAAAAVMKQMNEPTDAKNLIDLWEVMKNYRSLFDTKNETDRNVSTN